MRNAVRKNFNIVSVPFRFVSFRAVPFRFVLFRSSPRAEKARFAAAARNLEPSASRARVSERGDFLSGCARSFDDENANDRSRTEASRMVYERSTSEVVREWHLPVFSMQASSFFLNETARNQTKRNETKPNGTLV